jgi:hypothetical protein
LVAILCFAAAVVRARCLFWKLKIDVQRWKLERRDIMAKVNSDHLNDCIFSIHATFHIVHTLFSLDFNIHPKLKTQKGQGLAQIPPALVCARKL